MPFKVIGSSGKLISVKITGELKKAELDRMQAVATEFMKREGKIKMLVFLEDFLGWERGADWEDVNFQLEHDRDIEKSPSLEMRNGDTWPWRLPANLSGQLR